LKRKRSISGNDQDLNLSLFAPLVVPNEAAELETDRRPNDAPGENEPPPTRLGPENSRILLGTSAFTAAGWEGTFYPVGMKPAEYLRHYATRFRTVEVDSTFYGTPPAARVRNWYEKTPPDFVFAAKVPQVITHDKVLVGCDTEFTEFVNTMELLGEKLGPLLLQFGFFNSGVFKNGKEFLARLTPFLQKLPNDHRFAVEIRNKTWLDARFMDTLREHRVALALIDQSWMPRPWEMKKGSIHSQTPSGKNFDLITTDFAYVRWLGDRKGIEAVTKTWDHTVIDRREDLLHWVKIFRELLKRDLKVYAYANNHYTGNGPGTVKLFWDLFDNAEKDHK
jgi:uncharacterized protein YecE (DUF72 family)